MWLHPSLFDSRKNSGFRSIAVFEPSKTKANTHFYEAIVWRGAPAASTAATKSAKSAGTGIRYAKEGRTQVSDGATQIHMVENIRKVDPEGDVVALGGLTATEGAAASAATTTSAASTATATTCATTADARKTSAPATATACGASLAGRATASVVLRGCFPFAAESEGPTYAQIRNQRSGPLGVVSRNNSFAGDGIGIEDAEPRKDDSGFR